MLNKKSGVLSLKDQGKINEELSKINDAYERQYVGNTVYPILDLKKDEDSPDFDINFFNNKDRKNYDNMYVLSGDKNLRDGLYHTVIKNSSKDAKIIPIKLATDSDSNLNYSFIAKLNAILENKITNDPNYHVIYKLNRTIVYKKIDNIFYMKCIIDYSIEHSSYGNFNKDEAKELESNDRIQFFFRRFRKLPKTETKFSNLMALEDLYWNYFQKRYNIETILGSPYQTVFEPNNNTKAKSIQPNVKFVFNPVIDNFPSMQWAESYKDANYFFEDMIKESKSSKKIFYKFPVLMKSVYNDLTLFSSLDNKIKFNNIIQTNLFIKNRQSQNQGINLFPTYTSSNMILGKETDSLYNNHIGSYSPVNEKDRELINSITANLSEEQKEHFKDFNIFLPFNRFTIPFSFQFIYPLLKKLSKSDKEYDVEEINKNNSELKTELKNKGVSNLYDDLCIDPTLSNKDTSDDINKSLELIYQKYEIIKNLHKYKNSDSFDLISMNKNPVDLILEIYKNMFNFRELIFWAVSVSLTCITSNYDKDGNKYVINKNFINTVHYDNIDDFKVNKNTIIENYINIPYHQIISSINIDLETISPSKFNSVIHLDYKCVKQEEYVGFMIKSVNTNPETIANNYKEKKYTIYHNKQESLSYQLIVMIYKKDGTTFNNEQFKQVNDKLEKVPNGYLSEIKGLLDKFKETPNPTDNDINRLIIKLGTEKYHKNVSILEAKKALKSSSLKASEVSKPSKSSETLEMLKSLYLSKQKEKEIEIKKLNEKQPEGKQPIENDIIRKQLTELENENEILKIQLKKEEDQKTKNKRKKILQKIAELKKKLLGSESLEIENPLSENKERINRLDEELKDLLDKIDRETKQLEEQNTDDVRKLLLDIPENFDYISFLSKIEFTVKLENSSKNNFSVIDMNTIDSVCNKRNKKYWEPFIEEGYINYEDLEAGEVILKSNDENNTPFTLEKVVDNYFTKYYCQKEKFEHQIIVLSKESQKILEEMKRFKLKSTIPVKVVNAPIQQVKQKQTEYVVPENIHENPNNDTVSPISFSQENPANDDNYDDVDYSFESNPKIGKTQRSKYESYDFDSVKVPNFVDDKKEMYLQNCHPNSTVVEYFPTDESEMEKILFYCVDLNHGTELIDIVLKNRTLLKILVLYFFELSKICKEIYIHTETEPEYMGNLDSKTLNLREGITKEQIDRYDDLQLFEKQLCYLLFWEKKKGDMYLKQYIKNIFYEPKPEILNQLKTSNVINVFSEKNASLLVEFLNSELMGYINIVVNESLIYGKILDGKVRYRFDIKLRLKNKQLYIQTIVDILKNLCSSILKQESPELIFAIASKDLGEEKIIDLASRFPTNLQLKGLFKGQNDKLQDKKKMKNTNINIVKEKIEDIQKSVKISGKHFNPYIKDSGKLHLWDYKESLPLVGLRDFIETNNVKLIQNLGKKSKQVVIKGDQKQYQSLEERLFTVLGIKFTDVIPRPFTLYLDNHYANNKELQQFVMYMNSVLHMKYGYSDRYNICLEVLSQVFPEILKSKGKHHYKYLKYKLKYFKLKEIYSSIFSV